MRRKVYYRILENINDFYRIEFIGVSMLDIIKFLKKEGVDEKDIYSYVSIPEDEDLKCLFKFSSLKKKSYSELEKMEYGEVYKKNKNIIYGTDCLILTHNEKSLIFDNSLDDIWDKKNKEFLNDVQLIVISHDFDWQSVILVRDYNIINTILKYLKEYTKIIESYDQKFYN